MPQNKELTNLVKEMEASLKVHIERSIHEAMEKQEEKFNIAVNKLLNQFKEQQKEIDEISESQKFINKEFEDIKIKLTQINTGENPKIEEMENQIKELQKQLREESLMRDDLGQYIRRENLEFHGIPYTLNENTNHIVKQMVKKLNIEITDNDISTSHRLPPVAERHPAIIARFTNRNIRNTIYSKRATLAGTRDFGIKGMTDLYINDNLTPRRKKLFYRAYKKRSELKYSYIWTMNGEIFVRKDSKSPKIQINNETDVANLK